ncbi:MAG TPA: hypothetical protein DER01_00535 [Phycisphaerales bacterium]|nr:hypothetical protein [Phycisphaerales bacterium]|tara:strand:- start:92800 stop:93765 length:966 start_codon:yes stop_codon:yes gene_type:complete
MVNPAIELILWTNAQRAPLAEQIINQLAGRVTFLAIGGERQPAVTDLARNHDLPFDDDLRKLMIEHPPAGLLLLATDEVGIKDLESAAQSQMMIHTIAPVTSSIPHVSPTTVHCGLLPRFNQCAGWAQAADPLSSLGKLDQIHFTNIGPQTDATLFAQLVDSWEHLLSMSEMPTDVDAVLSSPQAIPESLEKITGHLCIQARLANGGCIQMTLSDRAAMSRRQMMLFGDEGQIIVTDTSYELYQPDGTIIDNWDGGTDIPSYAQLISDSWYNALTNPYAQAVDEALVIKRRKAALGCAHACLISARTGESETPGRVLELQV